jgi:spore coat protein U-like protein
MKLSQLGAASIFLALALGFSPAQAIGDACSISGSTSGTIGSYNPFGGAGPTQVTVYLNLTRYIHPGHEGHSGHETREVDFYFSQPPGSPAYDIRYLGSSVLYTLPATHALSLQNPPAGTVHYDFGSVSRPNTVQLPFVVTIPAGLNLAAGQPLIFDIVYICSGSGGLLEVSTPTTLPAAITLQVNVQSALQASYAGPALDFEEIGGVTDAQALTHSISGALRVASTGPFSVALSSANSYRMTYPGGNASMPQQSVGYAVRMLGQVHNRASPGLGTIVCAAPGTAGQNLPLVATLEEGGASKASAPNYQDNLTVTVTPLAVPYGGSPQNCSTLN